MRWLIFLLVLVTGCEHAFLSDFEIPINYKESVQEQSYSYSGTLTHIGGVIRNTGDGYQWIDDGSHRPLNVSPVVTTTDKHVQINYNRHRRVVTLVAAPDETYAQYVNAGASVGLSHSIIKFYDTKTGEAINPMDLDNPIGNFWIQGIFWD